MRPKIVAGNWKLNGDLDLIRSFVASLNAFQPQGVEVWIAPPLPLVAPFIAALGQDAVIKIGAQLVSAYDQGAYTGEVSASLLSELDVNFCLVGHSERRTLFGETDDQVALQTRALLNASITPVVCVGETLEQREDGETTSVVTRQIAAVFRPLSSEEAARCVVAYEPVWAIGTGRTATPEQAQQVHQAIRQHLSQQLGDVAESLPILYGGSVNSDCADELFAQSDIDGGLVGGASLKPEEFAKICASIG